MKTATKRPIALLLSFVLSASGGAFAGIVAPANATGASLICDHDLSPNINGRVVDGLGQPLAATVNVTFEIARNGYQSFVSTSGSTDENGNYELCPTWDENTNALDSAPAIGTKAMFVVVPQINTGSVFIKNMTITNDEFQCLDSGGPCTFDLVYETEISATGRPVKSDGLSDPGTDFSVSVYGESLVIDEQEGNYSDVHFVGNFLSNSDGTFNLYGVTEGTYRVELVPNSAPLMRTSVWQLVVDADGNQTWHPCYGYDGSSPVWGAADTSSVTPSGAIATLPTADAVTSFTLVANDGSDLTNVNFAFSDDYQLMGNPTESNSKTYFSGNSSCDFGGADFGTATCLAQIFPNYRGELLVPSANGFFRYGAHFEYTPLAAETQFVFQVANSEITRVWRATGMEPSVDGYSYTWTEVTNQISDNKFPLLPVDLSVQVADPNGYLQLSLCPFADDCSEGPPMSVWASTNMNGQGAFPDVEMLGTECDSTVDKSSNPEYQIRLQTEDWSTDVTKFAVDCADTSSGRTFKLYSMSQAPNGTKTVGAEVSDINALPMDQSRIVGRIHLPSGQVGINGQLDFYPIDSSGVRDTSQQNYNQNIAFHNYWGNDANSKGKFSLSALASGSYAISAYSDGDQRGTWGKARLDVVVDANGVVTSALYGTDLTQTPTTNVLDQGSLDITLNAPNFSATVVTQSGKPSKYQYIQIMKFDPDSMMSNGYEYVQDVGYTGTNNQGQFVTYLVSGQYKFKLPASQGQAETEFEIWIDSTGASCRFISQTGAATCGAEAVSSWTLKYAEPNLSGTISAGGTTFSSWLSLEKRNSVGYWEYLSNSNSDENGSFGFLLGTTGNYRIRANTSDETPEGYVSSYGYFTLDQNKKLCTRTANSNFDLIEDCPVNSLKTLNATLSLASSNLALYVEAPQTVGGVLLPAAWTSVSGRESTTEYWTSDSWQNNESTRQNGNGYLNLPYTNGQTRYFTIEFRPQSSNSSLILSTKSVEFCTQGDATVYVVTNNVCSNTPVDNPVTITLSEGNLIGQVKKPNGDALANNYSTWVNVTKWTNQDGSGSSNNSWGWSGAGNSVNTSSNGRFGGEVTAGIYRIQATSNNADYASSAAVIRVGSSADHSWCLISDDADSLGIADYGNTEQAVFGQGDCDPASDAGAHLDILLRTPNLQGSITDPAGRNVSNAWMQIYKMGNPNQPSGQYQSGLQVRSGRFSGKLTLPASGSQTYRLTFDPPWGTALARFSIDVECSNSGCNYTAPDNSVQQANALVVQYPTPNVTGKVCGPDSVVTPSLVCDVIKNSSLNVQKWNGYYWEWQNLYTSTNNHGEFSFNITTDGRYKISAYPSWSNPAGVQSAAEITVSNGGATVSNDLGDSDVTSNSLEIKLRGPNVSGSLKYRQSGIDLAMAYGWVSANLQCTTSCPSDWEQRWAGTGADKNGTYRLLLPTAGTWDIWAYPNFGKAARAPMHMTAVVAIQAGNPVVTSWDYTSTVTSEFTPSSGDVNFDALPSNVNVTISGTTEKRTVQFLVNGVVESTLTTATSGGTPNMVSTRLPAGTYVVKVLGSSRDSKSGTSGTITVGTGSQDVSVIVQ